MSQWKQLPTKSVDATQWDACIASYDREVFSEYWYWMAVCPSWQAWVKGDYEDVLALPIERKWGFFPMMRIPLYVKWMEGDEQQLASRLRSFFGFKRIHTKVEFPNAQQQHVQLLSLNAEWNASKELLKNVRKAERENPQLVEHVDWSTFREFMHNHHPYAWPAVQRERMQALYNAASERMCGLIVGVKMNDEWVAMQFYILRRGRAYLIQNVVNPTLRSHEPMAFLLHSLFLKWQQESSSTLVNFMGSNNPGVARFNEKFGTNNLIYWQCR
ncbi:MAG: GNAT family N-acetyltransferase [Flavobacteriales bacterium]